MTNTTSRIKFIWANGSRVLESTVVEQNLATGAEDSHLEPQAQSRESKLDVETLKVHCQGCPSSSKDTLPMPPRQRHLLETMHSDAGDHEDIHLNPTALLFNSGIATSRKILRPLWFLPLASSGKSMGHLCEPWIWSLGLILQAVASLQLLPFW